MVVEVKLTQSEVSLLKMSISHLIVKAETDDQIVSAAIYRDILAKLIRSEEEKPNDMSTMSHYRAGSLLSLPRRNEKENVFWFRPRSP